VCVWKDLTETGEDMKRIDTTQLMAVSGVSSV
jgi:hypothetical protein